ncbi:MAG TPA: di-heme oxidoredictase family protein [Chitinivibrionales bacterium]|nr:di-heme oxidoredictase family protein [Chitinivibrionales bacterium]
MSKTKRAVLPACILACSFFTIAPAVTYNFVHINFFTQDVSENASGAVFKYFPFKSSDEKAVISGVSLNYIKSNAPLVTVAMTKAGDYYTATVPAPAYTQIDFYYTLVCSPLVGTGTFSDDTKWFTKILGQPFTPSPKLPLTVTASGRFRDRHENEYRSDNFPNAYFTNTAYMLSFKDYGDSIEFAVFPAMNSSALEFHAFNHSVVDSICVRAEFALNMGAANLLINQHTGPDPKFPSGSPFGPSVQWYTTTVAAVSVGELVDFELLLTDPAGTRSYTTALNRYYVGSGKLGQRFQHPWANPAGDASISYITQPSYGFTQHCVNAGWGRSPDFLSGKALFDTDWKTGNLKNFPSDPDCNGSQVISPVDKSPFYAAGSLGPGYLQASCYECHVQAGAGHTADSAGDSLQAMVLLGVRQQGGIAPHPVYGDVLQCKAASGAAGDGQVKVSYTPVNGTFSDGEAYTLRKPAVSFVNMTKGPLDSTVVFSYRVSPLVCGAGLLEAVPEDSILVRADSSDRDGDGISGRANYAIDPVDGVRKLGRFGWKASVPSLKGEIAYLANRCIGLTSGYFPADSGGAAGAELSDSGLALLLTYAALCVPPPRGNWQDSSAIRGKALFENAGCVKCHVPAMHTGTSSQFPELNNLEIQPFTDLLLHDMGAGLADDYSQENASGSQWRTPPLWGIGFNGDAGGRESYLHDGRAQSIMEAVLWHDGEAKKAKTAVLAFSAQQRGDLVAFCKYPFADRLPRPLPSPVLPRMNSSMSSQGAFSCSPNPARRFTQFFIASSIFTLQGPLVLHIYNLRGQCVFSKAISAKINSIKWDVTGCESGTYFAFLSARNTSYRKEIVVMK